ncbi:MAG: hypothetical protein Ct9H300mP19_16270 [Dehalococcoidia bacterium]|nr:MAG: hypothetical protein Ct9H300mP19_16270 [Dehalococcoidia bacterium]
MALTFFPKTLFKVIRLWENQQEHAYGDEILSGDLQFGIPTGETLSEGLEEYLSESELKLARSSTLVPLKIRNRPGTSSLI